MMVRLGGQVCCCAVHPDSGTAQPDDGRGGSVEFNAVDNVHLHATADPEVIVAGHRITIGAMAAQATGRP
jgi:hypothetical protein